MADDADRAMAMVEMEVEAGIAAARPRGTGRADCLDCGEPIPEARRRAASWAVRCMTCQEAMERSR